MSAKVQDLEQYCRAFPGSGNRVLRPVHHAVQGCAWQPEALRSPQVGREESRLRRDPSGGKNGYLFDNFFPSRGCRRASPCPPSHLTVGTIV